MTDLSKNELPLEELPREDQLAICGAWLDGRLDELYGDEKRYIDTPLSKYGIYRIPAREPEYPWEHLAKWVKFCARDESGQVWAYDKKPMIERDAWVADCIMFAATEITVFNFERGDVPWQDSLRERPEGV